MFRSLHMKLVMIMLLLVTSLMAVVGAFLMTSVTNFYIDDFYEQMSEVFGESNAAFVSSLRKRPRRRTAPRACKRCSRPTPAH